MGCRRVADPSELVRVVRTEQGELAVGRALPGRGAWLCAASAACAERAARRGVFARALRAELAAGAVARLLEELAGKASEESAGRGPREDRGQAPLPLDRGSGRGRAERED